MAAISTWGTTTTSGTWLVSDCSASTTSTLSWDICDMKAAYKKFKANNYAIEYCDDVTYSGNAKISAGKKTIELPDGAKLHVDSDGNYRIEDQDAKVTYKANRIREFSPYLNASDMLAKFVGYVGSLGAKREEVLKLPLELFINWLIIEAAERDHDPIPGDIVPVAQHPQLQALLRPKCLTCGRFIKRLHAQHRFPFCSVEHGSTYVASRVQKPVANLPAPAIAG